MPCRRFNSSRTVTVDVDVDLDEFETDDLIEEVKSRGKGGELPERTELEDIHRWLSHGRVADAISALERLIWPKWRTVEQCEADFEKRRTA